MPTKQYDKKEKIELLNQLIKDNPDLSSTKLIEKAKQEEFSYRKQDMLEDIRNAKNIMPLPREIRQKSIPTKYKSSITIKQIPLEVLKEEKRLGRSLTAKEYSFETSKFGKMVREYQKRLGIEELDAIKIARSIVKSPKGVRAKKKLNKIDEAIRIQFNTP